MPSTIPEGYGLIAGRGQKNAAAALAAAAAAGVDANEVSVVPEGYVVPLAALDAYADAAGGDSAGDEQTDAAAVPAPDVADAPPAPIATKDYPDESWRNDDIKDWADSHGVDLDGATKKADMLAAIAATGSQ